MQYNPDVIIDYSTRLYSKAERIVLKYTILGAVIGFAAGNIIPNSTGIVLTLWSFILGAIGYYIGSEKSFQLKLQAQTALCQVQIEFNTRNGKQT